MTDRELLEFAAKAAGIGIMPCTCSSEKWPFKHNESATGKRGHWNPLVSDGDALRLAVKLGIRLTPYPLYSEPKDSVIASRQYLAMPDDDDNTYVGPDLIEAYSGDPYAATRRAIVRAAAEIGNAMP